jgi:hypothetical protein
MRRVLDHLCQDLAERHMGSTGKPDERRQELRFHAMGRNGNWPVVMTEGSGDLLDITSTLPLTIPRAGRKRVGELVDRLNILAEDGGFTGPDAVGRIHCQGVHRIPEGADRNGLRLLVERHLALVDRHLPSFFAVAAGDQTPTEAVHQLERVRRFA